MTTLRMCPPDLRAETLRAFERRLQRHAQESAELAAVAQQLGMGGVSVDLLDTHTKIAGIRLAVVGSAR